MPVLTGAHIIINGLIDDQERPQAVAEGVARRGLRTATGGARAVAAVVAGGLSALALAARQGRREQTEAT